MRKIFSVKHPTSNPSAIVAVVLAISLLMAPGSSYSQSPQGFKEVSGKYANSKYGVEIIFPEGYKGMELDVGAYTEVQLVGDAQLYMQIGAFSSYEAFTAAGKDIIVNGMRAKEFITEQNIDGTDMIVRYISIPARDDLHVGFAFSGEASDYKKEVGKFEKSLNTLKIKGAKVSNDSSTSSNFTILLEGFASLDKATDGFAKGYHTVYAKISGKYAIDKGKVAIDNNSLAGTLTIDNNTVKTLTIQKLSLAEDLKTINFTAKAGKSDTVTGKVAFSKALDFWKGVDRGAESQKSQLTVKVGKATLDTAKPGFGIAKTKAAFGMIYFAKDGDTNGTWKIDYKSIQKEIIQNQKTGEAIVTTIKTSTGSYSFHIIENSMQGIGNGKLAVEILTDTCGSSYGEAPYSYRVEGTYSSSTNEVDLVIGGPEYNVITHSDKCGEHSDTHSPSGYWKFELKHGAKIEKNSKPNKGTEVYSVYTITKVR